MCLKKRSCISFRSDCKWLQCTHATATATAVNVTATLLSSLIVRVYSVETER